MNKFNSRGISLSRQITSPTHSSLSSLRQMTSLEHGKLTTSNLSRHSNDSRASHRTTSRQSVTASNISIATSIAETDMSDIEKTFPRRWEEEIEMDKNLKILKQKSASASRLRKMNEVHTRLLEKKIRLLRSSYSHVSRDLCRETRHLQEEFQDTELLSNVHLPRIDSATSSGSRPTSSLSTKTQCSRSFTGEPTCQTCIFDPESSSLRCRHFPCCLPKTYNSLGMFSKPQTYSVVKNYKELMERCKDLRPPTSKQRRTPAPGATEDFQDIEEISHAPRISVKEKIRGVKQLVKEMKERNEKTKPRDWATNYGDPVPRRVILKPVKT